MLEHCVVDVNSFDFCVADHRKDYEKSYKKFLGLVKKQEQLLRGNVTCSNLLDTIILYY